MNVEASMLKQTLILTVAQLPKTKLKTMRYGRYKPHVNIVDLTKTQSQDLVLQLEVLTMLI